MNISTYPKMNNQIKDLLRTSDSNISHYAAKRIDELEQIVKEQRRAIDDLIKHRDIVEPQLKFASEDQKKGGWTLAPELLDELQDKIGMYEDAPSWEGIELVLLAFHGLPLPKGDEVKP